MTRKKRKKPVQQKGIHDNKRKTDTLIPVTLQETAVLFKLTKEDINQDYLEDNIPPINPTKIKNIVDFCQGENPKQELMKIDTDTEDLDRFNRQ